jgi:diguanylate cyclase (GGDEF)-like protein
MGIGGFLRLAGWLAGLVCALLLAAAVNARPPLENGPVHHRFCLSYGNAGEVLDAGTVARGKWRCDREGFTLVPEQARLLFELDPGKPAPRVFVSRRSPFERLHLVAIDADGTARVHSYGYGGVQPAHTSDFFTAQLPAITAETRYVLAAVDRPTQLMTLQRAHISPGDPGFGPRNRPMLLGLAALCGMLAMPLMFNLMFYRVLREPFVIWHSVLALALLLTVMLSSGLSMYFVPLSVPAMSVASGLVLGFSVAAGGMFARNFIEPDKLDPRLRTLLLVAAVWSIVVSALHTSFPFVMRAQQATYYYLAFVPVLLLYCAAIGDALRRGSRAAKFQVAGWLPLIGVGLLRQASQLTPLLEPTDAMGLFYIGCLIEVLATTAGVADRLMALKNQRDTALVKARMMSELSERDALTGLLNRRMIENHYPVLRAEGFTTLAVIDLDHFKSINDTFGHAAGDEVLKAVARALQPDDDTLAVRMGGEEFLLLMRGETARQRAEQRRRAIPQRVAAETRIDRIVTASMGLIEAPRDARSGLDFAAIYQRADHLLYEAKAAGRNRTMAERLKVFSPRGTQRRRRAAA